MKNRNQHIELFGKYLSGNCSDEERTIVENWLNQSPDSQAAYDEYKQVWKFSGVNISDELVDVDKGWNELNKRITAFESIKEELQADRFTINKKLVYTFVRIAAVFILAFGIFFLMNTLKTEQQIATVHYTASEIQDSPIVLADGSQVLLDKDAQISYPETFAAEVRRISFEGNAFFNIAHNPEKPFIITSGEIQIEVLGTSFSFYSCPEADEMILCLESGKVRFSSINIADGSVREQLILTTGEKAVYNKSTKSLVRSEITNQNYMAWKTGILIFEKTPLNEVICAIEQTYNLQIVSDKNMENLLLTARFKNETPENIFESLSTIFGIQYSFNGKTVLLK